MNTKIEFFAVVVDGEFCGTIGLTASQDSTVAGLKSNPTIVPITHEQLSELRLGHTYDGKEFKRAEG